MGRVTAGGVAALLVSAAGCRPVAPVEVKPGTAPRCERGVCVEIVSAAAHRATIGLWIEAPSRTSLLEARVSPASHPCGGDRRVIWVIVDRQTFRSGPAHVGGARGIVLGFEHAVDRFERGESYVDLELDVDGKPACVRSRFIAADGQFAVGK
jgi:hypothetical protein